MPAANDIVTIKPDLRVHHPEYGDMTEDVARALAEIRQQDQERLYREAQARQLAIAQATPGEARICDGFALKAQIDPGIVSYWRMREGAGFWKHELDWFLKRHPECAVKRKSDVFAVTAPGTRTGVTGKRGRWAL